VPTYEFKCGGGHYLEYTCPMSQKPASVECECGEEATQVFVTPPYIDRTPCREFSGFDVGLGRSFSSMRERKQFLKENGLHEWGPEQSETYDRRLRDEQQKKKDLERSTYTDGTIKKPMGPLQFGNFRLGAIKPAKRDIMPVEDQGKTIRLDEQPPKGQHHPALKPRVAKAIK